MREPELGTTYSAGGERSGGYAGIAFVVVLIVSALLPGAPPDPSASSGTIAAYVDAHRSSLLISAWLNLPAAAFFLWFAVGLRAYLAQARGTNEGLPTYALGAAVVTTALALLVAASQVAMVNVAQANAGAAAEQAMYQLFTALSAVVYIPLMVFVFAGGHSMRRHASGASWIAWLGYVAAAGSFIASFSLFRMEGAFAPNGLASVIISFVPFVVWVVAAGLQIVRGVPASGRTSA